MKYLLILCAGCIFFLACKKETPVFDERPEIRLVSAEPTVIQQFQDSIRITLEYQDGDGDLGFLESDSLALKVQDARLTAPDWYYVKPLAPLEAEVPITGLLSFKLYGTFLLGGGGTEKTIFTISIRDRANNWSNEISTPEITINP